jgi:hypothetical protein
MSTSRERTRNDCREVNMTPFRTIALVFFILWAFGFFGGPSWGLYGPNRTTAPPAIHVLIVIALILLLLGW